MGVCITSNHKDAISLDGGYSLMFKLRSKIANAYDKEFGKHYETLTSGYGKEFYEKFDKKTNEILSHERFKQEDEDIIDFLFAPDTDGKISYKTCKKIYDLITDIKYDNLQLRYVVQSNNDWEDFKELLKKCYLNKSNLIWY